MQRNINRGHCFVCGRPVAAGEGYRVFIRGRGYRVKCEHHATSAECYHGSSVYRAEKVGTEKVSSLAKTKVGAEFETEGMSADIEKYNDFRGSLERAGFCAEYDGSLDDGYELPSPPCEGVKSLSALLHSAENRGEDAFLRGRNCGMHLHAEIANIELMRNWYHTLFIPFCEWIDGHSEDFCKANFGGKFRGYAHKIDRNSCPTEHSNFVNTQHTYTLEWRLPRYTCASQTVILLKFWRKVAWMLNTTEWKEDADRATRKAIATKAGENIVKIAVDTFEKGDIDKLNRMTI